MHVGVDLVFKRFSIGNLICFFFVLSFGWLLSTFIPLSGLSTRAITHNTCNGRVCRPACRFFAGGCAPMRGRAPEAQPSKRISGCLRLLSVSFEGSIMWKQAANSELKNVDSTQTFELQNWFFFGADFTILENVTI